jgi:pyruvate formate lyase activating enzyme
LRKGCIFNIQRFSIHDGPGIRTTIFFKGCPLNCWWCHNPESQNFNKELVFLSNRCVGCGTCVNTCPIEAVSIINNKAVYDRDICNLCGECVEKCPANAVEFAGRFVSVNDILHEVKKDILFYDESNGGVTLSGGEPLAQVDFLVELVKCLKEEDINVAIDTSGYAPWEKIEKLASMVDLFLYDVKFIDDKKHIKYTGVSNKTILSNMEKLVKIGSTTVAPRVPLIPGINDDEKELQDFADFLSKINLNTVNILPYHDHGRDKYNRLGRNYKIEKDLILSDDKKHQIEDVFNKKGIKTLFGGGLK